MSTTTPVSNRGSNNVLFLPTPVNNSTVVSTNPPLGNDLLWGSSSSQTKNNINNSFTFGFTPPKIEVQHQHNRGFIEDDEGIVESGL
jgi:hypothetical protein